MSRRPEPDLDAEQEVDLGRYASAVAARWWLPLAGLLAGIVLGYVLSLGGEDVYRAQALLYLGEPLTPSGSAQVQGLSTNPSTIREVVRHEAVVRRVARETGLRPAELRAGISVQAASGNVPRLGQAPLVNIRVQGKAPRRIAEAANALAQIVVKRISGYVDTKIAALEAQIDQAEAELASIDERLAASDAALREQGLSAIDRLVILTTAGLAEQRRSVVQQDSLDRQQLLSLAENVERGRLLEPAVARKATAQSRRNSLVVAGAIGLLLGFLAALAWDSVAGRTRRSPA
ncbi:MAG: hypothetical protein ACRDN6_01370 [Gaiellaceae bacterium]